MKYFLNFLLLLPLSFSLQPLKAETSAFSDPKANVTDPSTRIPDSVQPLFDTFVRDTYVTLGHDGNYYLTGTTVREGRLSARDWNIGIELWKSPDLKTWTHLGFVWEFEKDGTWQKPFFDNDTPKEFLGQTMENRHRSVLAPEIHYIDSLQNYFIVASMPKHSGEHRTGSFILRSTSGKPTGPFVNIEACENGPITDRIDGALFEDDNGDIYLLDHHDRIAKMKPDMSGWAEGFVTFKETPFPQEPYIEGGFIVKEGGKYHLLQAVWAMQLPDGTYTYNQVKNSEKYTYDCLVATADSIYGPYSKRYNAITHGGHNNFFKDKSGKYWSTSFWNPVGIVGASLDHSARPSIIPLEFKDGRFSVDHE